MREKEGVRLCVCVYGYVYTGVWSVCERFHRHSPGKMTAKRVCCRERHSESTCATFSGPNACGVSVRGVFVLV
jgi:hypothetical protein